MKNTIFPKYAVKTLFFVLIVASAVAIPFALQQDAAAQTPQKEEPWDVVITIKADIDGKAEFVFEDYKIFYKHDARYEYPANASVNGISWPDLKKPFEMGFTPDFSFAKIYEKHGDGDIALNIGDNQFNVSIRDSGLTAVPYQVSIAMRRQKTDAPETAATTETEANGDGGKTAVPAMSNDERKTIAAELNRRGFHLLQALSEEEETENRFISPYSIDGAFGMVYTGAKGKTADEIRTVLGLPEDPADADSFFHDMAEQYHAAENADILVSNSIWADKRITGKVRPDYRRTIESYYSGAFYEEDFGKKDSVANKVNKLVDEKTKGMIKGVITPDDITERTRMILMNTLYFESKWKFPFSEEQTRQLAFQKFGGSVMRVPMMYQKASFKYYSNEEDNVHAVVLPYENPRFELVALMPIRPGADQGQAAMKDMIASIGDKLDGWLAKPSPYETRVWLPKVDLSDSMKLKDVLKKLGMTTPFDVASADFSGIAEVSSDDNFFIEKVIHKTALKMDEYSTKAAAATAIMTGFAGSAQPPSENIFRAERPFLVLIRDNQTGLILFMGRINDPGAQK